MLGTYLKIRQLVDINNVESRFEKSLPERHCHFIPMNIAGIKRSPEIGNQIN